MKIELDVPQAVSTWVLDLNMGLCGKKDEELPAELRGKTPEQLAAISWSLLGSSAR